MLKVYSIFKGGGKSNGFAPCLHAIISGVNHTGFGSIDGDVGK